MELDRPTYYIQTWGCQMNDEDAVQMALALDGAGYARADSADVADVVLLNTCSVRRKPEEKVYSRLGELRMVKSERPDLIVAVCGCMAQVESRQIRRRAPFVDVIAGTGHVAELPALLDAARARRGAGGPAPVEQLALPARRGAVVTDVPARHLSAHPGVRVSVPVMYGCDKFCTFCIVPLTRGRERSRPTDEIVAEVEALVRAGAREVTLLGQTVNSYGKNLAEGRVPFARLLERLDSIPGLARMRFTSPYPRDFTDDLIDTMARLPSVCEHVHLPLQVADDELLRRMHRGYTLAQYDAIVRKLRTAVPAIAVTTDIMLGFPGETDEQFANTLRYVEAARFDAAFMFAYSPRPGTKAAAMDCQVDQGVKVARLSRLIEVQNRISQEINEAMVGAAVEVMVDGPSERGSGRTAGLTRTFKTTHFAHTGHGLAPGDLVRVTVTEGRLTGLIGDLVPDSAPAA